MFRNSPTISSNHTAEHRYYLFWFLTVLLATLAFYIIAVQIQYKKQGREVLHGADPMYYFVYMRSIVMDHDLNFANEYEYFNIKEPINPDTGHPVNKYSIGFPLLVLPFFLFVHAIILFLNLIGMGLCSTGYSLPYQLSMCLGSIVYGYSGIIISYRLCRKFFPEWISFVSVTTLFLSSNLFYYFMKGPYYSHLLSFFTVSLFISVWLDIQKESRLRKYVILGVVAGLMTLVRQQDITFLSIPILFGLYHKIKGDEMSFHLSLRHIAAFGVGMFSIFLIQMSVWKVIFGSFITYSYGKGGFIYFASPKILEVLFSSRHGLISWNPIILFSLIGLLILLKHHRSIGVLFIIAFLLQLYINSSWYIWWFGYSFGHRGFINCTPIFIVGLASLISSVAKRVSLRYIIIICFLFVVWNMVMILAYLSEILPADGYFNWKEFFLTLSRLPAEIKQKVM